jgi:hypothetical protein
MVETHTRSYPGTVIIIRKENARHLVPFLFLRQIESVLPSRSKKPLLRAAEAFKCPGLFLQRTRRFLLLMILEQFLGLEVFVAAWAKY